MSSPWKKGGGGLLSLSDSEDDGSNGFQVNSDYAANYDKFRSKELLSTLSAKYGDESKAKKQIEKNYKSRGEDSEDSESSSSDDDSELEEDPAFEKQFLVTLSALKSKNESIYDSSTSFWKEPSRDEEKSKKKSKKEEKMTLADFERKILTEKDGKFEEIHENVPDKSEMNTKSYVQELQDIKNSIKTASKSANDDSDDDDDEGGLLSVKPKDESQKKAEEEDYRKWLKGQPVQGTSENKFENLKGLKNFWNKKDLDESESFLKDYILNKRYLAGEGHQNSDDDDDEMNEEEIEREEEKMDEFEHKYNFRFEEPDQDFIKRYPRTINDTMRKKNDTRAKKRQEVKIRKEAEKEKQREELKTLKALKRQEIMKKLEQIKSNAGAKNNEDLLDFKEEDLEGDFDPNEYDKRMKELFQHYDGDIEGMEDKDKIEKPIFSDLEDSDIEQDLDVVENWDDWEGRKNNKQDDEDNDDENDGGGLDEESKLRHQREIILSLGKRKGKKKSKFSEIIESQKPRFDAQTEKTFSQYLDEYYSLDYEDMIDNIPCRFKYRNVQANDYGLDVNEILSAPDRELNTWCSLKKTHQYRTDEEEKRDLVIFKNKGKDLNLKKKLLPSLFESNTDQALEDEALKKSKKGKKNRKRKQSALCGQSVNEENCIQESSQQKSNDQQLSTQSSSTSGNKRKRRKKNNKNDSAINTSILNQLLSSSSSSSTPQNVKNNNQSNDNKKKRNRKKGSTDNPKASKINPNADVGMSDTRLQAYGLAPGQFKRKLKKRKYREMAANAASTKQIKHLNLITSTMRKADGLD